MGITNFDAVSAALGASARQAQNARYVFTQFRSPPLYTDEAGGAASGSDAGINILDMGDARFQVRLEQAVTASPVFNSANTGLLINVDDTDNEGLEINLGRVQSDGSTLWTNSKGAFVIGTDAFFVRVKLSIGDVSDSDQLAVGFSVGGYPADGLIGTYTDLAVLNVNAGDVIATTRLNSGSVSTTDTTDNVADAGTVTLEVRVSAAGVAKFLIDGADPTVIPSTFTFDSGDIVHAFYSQLNAAVGDPTVTLLEWESGLMSARGLDGINDLVN